MAPKLTLIPGSFLDVGKHFGNIVLEILDYKMRYSVKELHVIIAKKSLNKKLGFVKKILKYYLSQITRIYQTAEFYGWNKVH